MKSFAVWCLFKNDAPATNSCRFATREEAEEAGRELLSRWFAPSGFEVRESEDPVNYRMQDGRPASL